MGHDQKQHVEVTRDLAQKFNQQFRSVFTLPEPVLQSEEAKVVGLDGQKMSKSYDNVLPLFGPAKKFKQLIMRIPTDSTPVEDPKPIEGSTLVHLYRLVASEEEQEAYNEQFERGGVGYGDLKKALLERLNEFLGPMREKYAYFESRPQRSGSHFDRRRPTRPCGRLGNAASCTRGCGIEVGFLSRKQKAESRKHLIYDRR